MSRTRASALNAPEYNGPERRGPDIWGPLDKVSARIISLAALIALVLSAATFLGISVDGTGTRVTKLEGRQDVTEDNIAAILVMTCYMAQEKTPNIVQPECNKPRRSRP
jgi:hypothetical protein